jgi:hypothetical protein
MNPTSPQPPYFPPPPPPATPSQGGSPVKWILITCGVLTLLGVLSCGGCMLWGYSISRGMMKQIEEAKRTIESDSTVSSRIGKVRTAVFDQVRQTQTTPGSVVRYFDVSGEREDATVEMEMKMTGFSFETTRLTLVLKSGDRVELPRPKP